MIQLLFALDHHIVNVSVHGLTHQRIKHFGDHSSARSTGVLQPEGHDFVAKYVTGVDKK